jgi:hypothetical protein
MMFTIQPRGKKQELVLPVKGIPGNAGSFMPLKFPCLSVHVTTPTDNYPKEYYSITWSNYARQEGVNPGKFKIQRIKYELPKVWAPSKDKFGNRFVDQIEINKNPHRNKERVVVFSTPPEFETVSAAIKGLTSRLDDDVTRRIIDLIVSHDLYRSFLKTNELAAA